MFTAKCNPKNYKPFLGDYAVDANGEIAVAFNHFYMIPVGRGQWIDDCNVTYRSFIGDSTSTFKRNDTSKTSSFQPVRYIAKADIINHFNMNVIYNYRTYTQAFYDIFTLNGDDIELKNSNSSNSKFSPKEKEQNTLLLEQNALLLEQNGLLLQLLTLRNVPVQADLLQM